MVISHCALVPNKALLNIGLHTRTIRRINALRAIHKLCIHPALKEFKINYINKTLSYKMWFGVYKTYSLNK
jgi:hypothetical protein